MPSETWDWLGRGRFAAVIARWWEAFVRWLARGLESGSKFALTVRTIRLVPRQWEIAAAVLALAYISVVNLSFSVPGPLAQALAPFRRLPRAWQSWTLMKEPMPVYARLAVEGTLADGTRQTFVSDRDANHPVLQYLWPPRTERETMYHFTVLVNLQSDVKEAAAALCDYHRRRWDATHAPDQRVVRISVIYVYEEIRPAGVSDDWPVKAGRQPMYTWQLPDSSLHDHG
jgi:hypothetical protein